MNILGFTQQKKMAGIGPTPEYLTFHLNGVKYGVPILKIRKIVGRPELTEWADSSPCIRGIMSHHEAIVPVIDLRVRLHLPPVELSKEHVVIVVEKEHEGKKIKAGLLVDAVVSIVKIGDSAIQPVDVPSIPETKREYIVGAAHVEEDEIIILDPEKILTEQDASQFSECAKTGKED